MDEESLIETLNQLDPKWRDTFYSLQEAVDYHKLEYLIDEDVYEELNFHE